MSWPQLVRNMYSSISTRAYAILLGTTELIWIWTRAIQTLTRGFWNQFFIVRTIPLIAFIVFLLLHSSTYTTNFLFTSNMSLLKTDWILLDPVACFVLPLISLNRTVWRMLFVCLFVYICPYSAVVVRLLMYIRCLFKSYRNIFQ